MKTKKFLALFLATLLFVLSGCGTAVSDNKAALDREESYSYGTSNDSLDVPSKSTAGSLPTDRKLIRTANMEAETDDLDALMAYLDQRISQLGGYVEARQIRNMTTYRSGELTVRIPAERMDEFTGNVAEKANVTYRSEDVDDITLTYVDTQSRVKALETEQTRLLELLEKAENMSDILAIESKLAEVRGDLESVTSQLRLYDNQVDYATVRLTVTQVTEYTVVEEQTVWERISTGFVSNLKNMANGVVDFFVFLIVCLPLLIPVAVIAVIVILIVRRRKKKNAKKTPPPPMPPKAES